MKKFTIFLFFAGMILSSNVSFAQNESYLKNRILVEGIYKRNLGNFSEVWSNASGGYLNYGIAFPDHNLLILRIGFISNSLKDGVDYEDASSVVVPLHVGGRYYFIDDIFMPFVSFMNGLNIVFENTTTTQEGVKEDRTLVKYAFQVGAGVSVNLVSSLVFDLSVNYNSHFYHTDAMMTAFEYTFGLGWTFQ